MTLGVVIFLLLGLAFSVQIFLEKGNSTISTTIGCNQANGEVSGNLAPAYYNRQMSLTIDGNFSSLVYNVTAVEQNDSFGYGPAYLINGLSDKQYWYQLGLGWNIASGNLAGFTHGFRMVFDVLSPSAQLIFPQGGSGENLFSGIVRDQDIVGLSLRFSNSDVIMSAYDWNTSATSNATYSAMGADMFVGNQSGGTPEFTGLMTEWYLACANFVSARNVTYSNTITPIPSGTMCIDESNLAPGKDNGVSTSTRQVLFSSCSSDITFQNESSTFLSFGANGVRVYADSEKFVTD
jgi:hypothetical protein